MAADIISHARLAVINEDEFWSNILLSLCCLHLRIGESGRVAPILGPQLCSIPWFGRLPAEMRAHRRDIYEIQLITSEGTGIFTRIGYSEKWGMDSFEKTERKD